MSFQKNFTERRLNLIQKLTGIVIRETKINEADKMLTVLTNELGPVSVMAKNVRKNKSRISSGASLLCYSDFVLSGGPEVYYINQCSLIENFYKIGDDIQKLSLATYMGQITADLSPAGEPQSDAVKLFLNTLYILANTDKNIFLVKSVFELRLMMCQGYMPDVFSCRNCGQEKFPYYFDLSNSNVICSECGKSGIKIEQSVMYAIRYILTAESKKIFSFELEENQCKELAYISRCYVVNHLGYVPKTLDYFEMLM